MTENTRTTDMVLERSFQSFEACRIIDGGPSYFREMKSMISSATKEIHLQLYRFDSDKIGREIQNLLIEAAARGVNIQIVVDGYGSKGVDQQFIDQFNKAGIQIAFFSPIHFNFRFRMGRRLHHKFLLVDSHEVLIGGVNIADKYHGSPSSPAWLDFAIYLKGENCQQIEVFAKNILSKKIDIQTGRKPLFDWKNQDIRFLENDIIRSKRQIRRSYYQAISHAQKSITIFAAYFVPSYRLLKLLFDAAERGVNVRLVLPSVSDTYLYEMAVKFFYSRLLKHRIRILEYKPAILHAKVAVIDDEWSTVGSYNLNYLSDLLSTELNVESRNRIVTQELNDKLEAIMANDCEEVEPDKYLKASLFNKIRWRFYYRAYLISIRLLRWFTSRERKNFIE